MIQTTPPLQQLVSFSHQLADQSGSAILPYYRTTLNVDDKGAGHRFDPVTEGDRAAETIIRNAITAHFPSHAILGEEHGESLSDSRYRWVIDPIDGTRAFILGVPTWGTLIGLEIDGKPAIGMMNQPHTGDRFWSDGQRIIPSRGRTRATPTENAHVGHGPARCPTWPPRIQIFSAPAMKKKRSRTYARASRRPGSAPIALPTPYWPPASLIWLLKPVCNLTTSLPSFP